MLLDNDEWRVLTSRLELWLGSDFILKNLDLPGVGEQGNGRDSALVFVSLAQARVVWKEGT